MTLSLKVFGPAIYGSFGAVAGYSCYLQLSVILGSAFDAESMFIRVHMHLYSPIWQWLYHSYLQGCFREFAFHGKSARALMEFSKFDNIFFIIDYV